MLDYPKTDRLRGLGLPALKQGQGYFSVKEKYDCAWSDLLMALFTAQGSRPARRNLGSTLRELLFAPIAEIDEQIVAYVVKETVERNCPHLQVQHTRLRPDEKGIYIEVAFSFRADTTAPVQKSVLVPKTFITG